MLLCDQPPRPTQPPTLSGMGNEYQPKLGDALWLGVKAGMAHFICECTFGWQVKLCDPSLTRATSKCLRNESIIKCNTNILFTYLPAHNEP